ncbi:hypothetical protein LC613_39980 [Nostoc sphaeroides CHAB 2801]|uniref:hypothetical protein n=1 Tax=Nostoc sphaeroides TaxID=446679 RepID=UPI001E46FEC7|nr:hypothetical protein [Nostoc sphaeroides]MCC5633619.1 hypothetical protein [Nostoc sphaeroides CHAB 2801]
MVEFCPYFKLYFLIPVFCSITTRPPLNAFEDFAQQHPGYRAVLGQLIDLMTVTDASKFNEYDQQILVELADFFSRRNLQLDATQSRLIATTVVKVSNELLWLSFTREPSERKQLVKETKTLITAYLQTYQI